MEIFITCLTFETILKQLRTELLLIGDTKKNILMQLFYRAYSLASLSKMRKKFFPYCEDDF
ncbi:hypothetical protein T4B_5673 [Trichinella pseudospiralis]|uniref:Uncharacterized protein n=2 Tax=Trichinella pseudospiralis TaxID=6337 RepID=A0A0V1I9K4_TRIPS|nr:hypothetical protein T4D_4797 [Trichinella pseudospiralis]KRZ19498.1 hypothetical protein T4B_5673 [Trichinella pseudospiralis]KRZ29608.1 hypothetical protein T4C_23 [Trichinella pseudospiralis]